MLFIIYFQSSFSHVQNVKVNGNYFASSEWVISESRLEEGVSMWNLGVSGIVDRLTAHEAIKSVEVSREWLTTVHLDIEEYERIAYIFNGDGYDPVLITGDVYTNSSESDHLVPYDAPVLRGFEDDDIRKEMVNELAETPSALLQRMSDIILEPTENDTYRLTILMNDGFTVSSTVRHFAQRIAPYPSVVEQLDPDVEGIVHMRMNPYFERFDVDEEGEDSESQEE
ncbi:FtsQ-type POTRA domain-containing protein [Salipaludibacillus sp. LMS25]|jgi:cell division protein FtsQ|nr:FtsQ-type POTRA domain-containing protein [Salipaludibacillus sp. LMS25]UTR15184.1 FtsQ-type POTRA domain-containing protein [Salipaludibacillus sp. LMS25]